MTETQQAQIAFSELLGRRVRLGPWEDQKISTYSKIQEALHGGRWDEAASLANYFVDEANVCFTLYRQWIADLNGYLRDRGVASGELQEVNARIVDVLRLPDGEPWIPHRQWYRFITDVEEFVALAHRERLGEALSKMGLFKENWRRCHDRDVDHRGARISERPVGRGRPLACRVHRLVLEQQADVRNLAGHPLRVDAPLQVPAVHVVNWRGAQGQVHKLAHFPQLTRVVYAITPGQHAQ